jgi:hypothetical protein
LYEKMAYAQHLATVASGELLQMAGFFLKNSHGARRRPKVLLVAK